MYLKRIEISGFKSFANRINLDFTDGITCIVGPNGSGKSNVADAVRWVLGEQSARQLRGSNMQDIIFSGTQNRRPQGSAYVAITMDNSDRSLNLEYDEVTVSRRVYRSGESEYMMNGAACRLRDIYELFYDTGIGKEGYSIIGQGQIDRIVSGRPEERRELLDEAAGIVKFKKRKAVTLKKLESEEANLVRVSDILSELEKQVEPLKRQSALAKEYLRLKDDLRLYDIRNFLLESETNDKRIGETAENARIVGGHLEEARETAGQWKEQYEEMAGALEELNRQIEDCHGRGVQAGIRKENLEGHISLLREQIRSEEQSDEHYGSRMKSIEEQLAAHEAEKAELTRQKGELNEELDRLDDEQTEKQALLEALDDEIRNLEFQVEHKKKGIIDTMNEKAGVGVKMQRYDTLLEQSSARQAQIRAQLLRVRSEMETWQETEDTQEEERALWQEKLSQLTAAAGEASARTLAFERQIAGLQKEQSEAERQVQSCAARLESLKNIAERYEGYGNSVRRVMEAKNRYPGVVGVVADLIEADKKYEIAIETALGGSIQNIVTETEICAKGLISYLKQNRYGRATFLPLESIRSSGEFKETGALREPGAIGLADTLVRVAGANEALARYLLGRVLVVDHIDHALAIARKYHYRIRMVTLEGELLNTGGSLTGGAFKNSSNLLGRKREIDELTASLTASEAVRDEKRDELQRAVARQNEQRALAARLKEEAGECRLRLNTADMNLCQAREKYQELQKSCDELGREAGQIDRQKLQIEESRSRLRDESESLEERNRESEEEIHEHGRSLEEKRAKRDQDAQILSQVRLSFETMSQKDSFLLENILRVSKEMEALHDEAGQIREGILRSKASAADKQARIEAALKELQEVEEQKTGLEAEAAELSARREKESESQKIFISKREVLLEEVNRLDKEAYRLESQLEKYREQKESLIHYLWSEYELTPAAAREFRRQEGEADSLSHIRTRTQELRKEIRDLGDVNVNAIEEYREVYERYSFLKGQHDDLTEAKESLEQIIAELDEGMRRQFTEKFEEIKNEFDTVFKELFGGGHGTLSLTEDEDLLTAGVQIIAQPPGKKLQNMMQLSGGEKALTAISLLFAIQNLKPSPFCLLDEIEAALDDSNVDRFAGYLSRLTGHTQFILITHRRGTMLRADRLYGITMQEKGVSTLVSVNLTEEGEEA
ncbi:MAG: chromosome segregation protein SMC [Lachnospiraceae bacterium]|jgi:chromosome segregation protein|nr:chromosome segregation protein SMC [Lachnospiraceae bacterium]